MLTDDEVAALFREMEADRAERKRSFQSAAHKVRQAHWELSAQPGRQDPQEQLGPQDSRALSIKGPMLRLLPTD